MYSDYKSLYSSLSDCCLSNELKVINPKGHSDSELKVANPKGQYVFAVGERLFLFTGSRHQVRDDNLGCAG